MPPTSPQVPWIDDEGNFRPLADEEFALLDPRIGATQAYVNAFRMDYNRNLPTVAEKNNGVIDPEEVQNAQKYLQSDPHWYLREIITRTIARYRLIADGQIIFDINNNQAQIRAAFIAMMSLCTIKDSSIQPPTDAEITDKTLMLQWVAKLKANSNIGDVLCVSNHQDGRLDIVLNGVLDGKTFCFVWQV